MNDPLPPPPIKMSGPLPPLPFNPETNNGYVPVRYVLPGRVQALSKAPRFTPYACTGYFFDDDTKSQYLVGLTSGTIIVMCVYIVWSATMLVWKLLGPGKVGCWSGSFRSLPPRPVDPRIAAEAKGREKKVGEEADDKVSQEDEGNDKDTEEDEEGANVGIADGDTLPTTPLSGGRAEENFCSSPLGEGGKDTSPLSAPSVPVLVERAPDSPGGDGGDTNTSGASDAKLASPLLQEERSSSAFENDRDYYDVFESHRLVDDSAPNLTAGVEEPLPPFATAEKDSCCDEDQDNTFSDDDDDYDVSLAEWEIKQRRYRRRLVVSRAFFLLSGVMLIVCSFLFYGMGVTGLNDALVTITQSVDLLQYQLWNAYNLTYWFASVHTSIHEARVNFTEAIDSCPEVLEPLENSSEFANNTALEWLRRATPVATTVMGNLSEGVTLIANDIMLGLEDAVYQMDVLNENVQNKVSNVFWISVAVIALLNFLAVVIVIAAVSKWCRCRRNKDPAGEHNAAEDDDDWWFTKRSRPFRTTCCSFCPPLSCSTSSIVTPLFIILGFLGWLTAGIFVLVVVAGSDFCVAPDVYVANILGNMRNRTLTEIGLTLERWKGIRDIWNQALPPGWWNLTGDVWRGGLVQRGGVNMTYGDAILEYLREQNFTEQNVTEYIVANVTDLAFQFVLTGIYDLSIYYVGQCRIDLLPSWYYRVEEYLQIVSAAANDLTEFLTEVGANHSIPLEEICGEEVAARITANAAILNEHLRALWYSLVGALELLMCQSVNPIYNRVAHDAVCVEGIEWLTWSFGTVLGIAFFSMMMVSLRASWHTPVDVQKESSTGASKSSFDAGTEEEAEQEQVARRHETERCQRRCSHTLWGLLFVLMISLLIALIAYSLDGFNGRETSRAQCPAESIQNDGY